MTIYILKNGFYNQVVNDLKTICPDPNLTIDSYGRVVYNTQSMSSVGCQTVKALSSHTSWIGIRGEIYNWYYDPRKKSLFETSGIALGDIYPGTRVVHIVYDATNCEVSGSFFPGSPSTTIKGRFVVDSSNQVIPFPTHVLLYHELSHALRYCTGRHDVSRPEDGAIADENQYRTSLGMPLRSGYVGGCIAMLFSQLIPPPDKRPRCFIAESTQKSILEPKVRSLRKVRDSVLRKTRFGEEFFSRYYEQYYRISPLIASAMKQDPQTMKLVRWSLVYPIVQYLWLLERFPDEPFDNLGKPWRSFLLDLRNSLEEWTKEIELPYDFDGLSARSAAKEMEMVMRYVLRRDSTRMSYLQHLKKTRQIPLKTTAKERKTIIKSLESSGRSEREIRMILGTDDDRSTSKKGNPHRPQSQLTTGTGDDHTGLLDTSQWIYTLTITNHTTDTFDRIVLFYKRLNLNGVVYLEQLNVQPNQVRVFNLGRCTEMESYAFGCFIGDDMVIQFPRPGVNATPDLASKLNPADIDPCADSFGIYEGP